MATTLIIGSKGFIGSCFVADLCKRKHNVVIYDEEITQPKQFSSFLESQRSEIFTCFHLSAISSVAQCETDPERCQAVNSQAPALLAKIYWAKYPSGLFIFPSTAHVYQSSENALKETDPVKPTSHYARSKLDGENLLRTARADLNSHLLILRLFNHTHKTQPATYFFPSVHSQLQKSANIKVGNIDILRDFGNIQDLLSGFNLIVQHPERFQGEVLCNFSSGKGKLLRSMIEELARAMRINPTIEVSKDKQRGAEPASLIGDNHKIRSLLNWQPHYGLSVQSFVQGFLKPL